MSPIESRGVSPVIAVILMVAVTVVLSAAVGMLVFDLSEGTESASTGSAGIDVTENDDGTVTVTLMDAGTTERVVVQNSTGARKNLTKAGDAVRIHHNGKSVNVFSANGESYTLLQTYDLQRLSPRIDGFEDSDLLEYQGDTSPFVTQSTRAYEGDTALKAPSGSGTLHMYSQSALNRYPQPGETFRVRGYADATYDFWIATWGYESSNDYYRLAISDSYDSVGIQKMDSGSLSGLNSVTYDGGKLIGEWFYVDIKWEIDGTITATVYNQSGAVQTELTATDSELTGSGVGFAPSEGGTNSVNFYYDGLKVINGTR